MQEFTINYTTLLDCSAWREMVKNSPTISPQIQRHILPYSAVVLTELNDSLAAHRNAVVWQMMIIQGVNNVYWDETVLENTTDAFIHHFSWSIESTASTLMHWFIATPTRTTALRSSAQILIPIINSNVEHSCTNFDTLIGPLNWNTREMTLQGTS